MVENYEFDLRKLDPDRLEKDIAARDLVTLVGIGENDQLLMYVPDPSKAQGRESPMENPDFEVTVTIQRKYVQQSQQYRFCIVWGGRTICF
jgi:hypothetical protein